jgi:hypothetical protein
VRKAQIFFGPPPPPPATRGSIDVQPSAVGPDQPVSVTGTGFRPQATVEVLQCPAGPTNPTECGVSPSPVVVRADASGGFVTQISVAQFLSVEGEPGRVDCSEASPGCVIAAGEVVDFPNTVVTATIDLLVPPQPDVVLRRVGGASLTGDGVYNETGWGQTRRRRIAPGERWAFSLQIQNDGPRAGTVVLTGSATAGVRYFIGYYDITAAVTGSGFRYEGMPPGASYHLGVQIRVPSGATPGTRIDARVTASSTEGSLVRSDVAVVGAVVLG